MCYPCMPTRHLYKSDIEGIYLEQRLPMDKLII